MEVTERTAGDAACLEGLIATEARAKQRDRYRIALLAIRGREKPEIAGLLGVAKSTVETWAYRYRDRGIDALRPRRPAGRRHRLPVDRHEAFKERIKAGPRAGDTVCTLRGRDAVRILKDEFGVVYSLNGAYRLLHRLDLSCLTPRPRHEQNDPEAMDAFKAHAPLLSAR